MLNIPHILVCVHSHCGAIQGLFKQIDKEKLSILQRWLTLGEEAKQMTLLSAKPSTPPQEIYTSAEMISIVYQLKHLMTFPFIKKRVEEKKLELHGWYYEIESGMIWYYNTEKYQFIPLKALSKS